MKDQGCGKKGDTCEEKVVVFGFSSEVLEDRLFPEPLHVIPIINLAVSNGIVYAIARRCRVRDGFIADEEVKILNTALAC